MLKIILISFCLLIEIPFIFKYIQAKKEFEIIKQTAIIIIMMIIAIIFFGIYKLSLFMIG
ncbi:unknown [Clostridium sp. CAG:768]|jgi:hypothetical protein|nr:unknown [Clostridium sp. CAG:768]